MAMDGGMSLFLNYVPVCTHPPPRSVLRLHGNISRVLGNRISGHTTRGWRNIINLVSSINLAEYQFVINIQHPASKREEGTEHARQVDKVSLGRLLKEMILAPAGVAKLMRKHFTRTKCFDLE